MALLDRMQQQVNDVKRRSARQSQKASLSAVVSMTEGTPELLTRFPEELQRKVFNKALVASANVVLASARAKIAGRRSRVTGTALKQSKKVKQARADRDGDLYDSLRGAYRIRQYEGRTVAFIGPRRPIGNHGHLEEFDHVQYLWGKTPILSRGRPFLQPAADETKSDQQRAFVKVLNREWTKV